MIKNKKPQKFNQVVSELASKKSIPFKVIFELTYRCNFKCIHCYNSPSLKKEINVKQAKEIIDKLYSLGCMHIGFSGGEPFLVKDIFDILEYAKAKGFKISILTNGYLIDDKCAKRIGLLGNSLNRVDISLLGVSDKTCQKITGVKNSFQKAFTAVKLLKKQRVNVQIKSVLLKSNQKEFLKIKAIAQKLKVMFRYGLTVSPKACGNTAPWAYRADANFAGSLKMRLLGRDYFEKKISDSSFGRTFPFSCGVGKTEMTISPYGEMNFCPEIAGPNFNILKGSEHKAWDKITNIVSQIKIPKDYLCGKCVLALFCEWCPAKAWLSDDGLKGCDEECRRRAMEIARASEIWQKIKPLLD